MGLIRCYDMYLIKPWHHYRLRGFLISGHRDRRLILMMRIEMILIAISKFRIVKIRYFYDLRNIKVCVKETVRNVQRSVNYEAIHFKSKYLYFLRVRFFRLCPILR